MTYSERIKDFFETFDTTGSVYQAGLLIPEVVDDAYFEILKPKQKFYECKKYERKTEISSSEVERKLSELVKANVPTSPIFSYFKRKNAFIAEHKHSVELELKAILEKEEDKNEAEFNKSEREIKVTKDAEYKREYEEALAEYENIFNPSNEWLNENFENYFDKIVKKWSGRPIASGAAVTVNKDAYGSNKYSCTITVDNLTDFYERVPYKYSITAAGNLSQRQKTNKQIEEEYTQNICALAFIYAVCLFNVCLDAKEVLISCYLNHIDSTTGNEETRYLYSVIIPRELVKTFKMENVNTVAALMSLEGRADIRKEREIYFIDPIEWNIGFDAPVSETQNELNIEE